MNNSKITIYNKFQNNNINPDLAVQILGTADAGLRRKLASYKKKMAKDVLASDSELQKEINIDSEITLLDKPYLRSLWKQYV